MTEKLRSPIPPEERKKFKYDTPADQAEGERDEQKSSKVKGTPDQAEGDREKVEEDLREQERKRDKK